MRQGIIILLLFTTLLSNAQEGEIQLLARAKPDRILLRWAPTSSVVWELVNKYGYTVERYTMLRDSVLLDQPEYVVLEPRVIKPKPQSEWEAYIDDDDFVATAAQAIFGETFELTQNYDQDVFQIAQKTKERDQRFSFTLFAADQSFKSAELSGLGIADFDVKENETYLYRVISNIPSTIYKVDTAAVYLNNSNISPLPEIQDVEVEFGDKRAAISWNKSLTDHFYNAFIVEKLGDDEGVYRPISKKPIINAYSGENEGIDRYFKMDTLNENNRIYSYRVIGITPFGEKGPPSDEVNGMGKPTIDAVAGITKHVLNSDENVQIFWQFPKEKESLIDGFVLEMAPKQEGPYTLITDQRIAKSFRSYTVQKPRSSGYYRIGLSLKDQVLNASFPYLIQLEDSIAPAPPMNFISDIKSSGVVRISWDKNNEADFWGYRVYRSNFKKVEFAEITSEPIPINSFSDSLSIENLTEKMYYKIIAVDLRDNRSAHSEIIEINKPDIIPPSPPVFNKVESRQEGAWMSWHSSSSADLEGYLVFRGVEGSSNWELIANLTSLNVQFLDTSALEGRSYLYTIVAFDDVGLESKPIKPILIGKLMSEVQEEFKRFTIRAEKENKRIVLFWKLGNTNVKQIQIYRGINDQPMSLYKTIDATDQFVDMQIIQNQKYSYQIKAMLVDGRDAGLSRKIEVVYR
jgi:uncharacterized protein